VVLTVAPDTFDGDPERAYEYAREKRAVSNFIWNLKRAYGIRVISWVWVMEFYKTGFFHYHLLVELDKRGMIGGDRIRRYWGLGDWVHEEYFRSEKHWRNLVGYFNKVGYFDKGSKYQGRLPDWALKRADRMRKFGRMVVEKTNRKGAEKMNVTDVKSGEVLHDGDFYPMTYEARLEKCGARVRITLSCDIWEMSWLVNKSYDAMRKSLPGGKYIRRLGYVARISEDVADCLMDLIIREKDCSQEFERENVDGDLLNSLYQISHREGVKE
jgi:hypothetical protein